jgi:hypothetical protein
MKKLHLLLIILTITISSAFSAFGQKGTTQQITINDKGWLLDSAGTKLAYITRSDVVRDNNGKGLYSVDLDGNVIAADGRKLGTANNNGSFVDAKGLPVLETKDISDEQCQILDPKGNILGTVHPSYKQHACAAYCYWLTRTQ